MSDTNQLAGDILDALLEARRTHGDAALIEALSLLTERSGENKYRHAASIVRGTVLGRTAIDDGAALRRIAAFPSERRREAVGVVAKQVAGAGATENRIEAIARRLRRKLKKETDKIDLSVSFGA